jgi:hypothetical protein
MRCEPELLQSMRKRHKHTEFACFIKNVTGQPLRLTVSFGQMEAWPRMSEAEREELLKRNRFRYSATSEDEVAASTRTRGKPSGFALGEQEIL